MSSRDGKHGGGNEHASDGVPRRRLSLLAVVAFVLGAAYPVVAGIVYRLVDSIDLWTDATGITLLGVIALGVLSIVWVKIRRKRLKGESLPLAGILIAVLWMLFLPTINASKKEARQMRCRSNLRRIGTALQMYAEANGGWGPMIEPEARRIANAACLPAGCLVTFKDADGRYKATGLGLLYTGGYFGQKGHGALYCPSTHGSEKDWVRAFTQDNNETLWRNRMPGRTDGDGVGELPGSSDVMVCSYILRYNTENQWGAFRLADTPVKAIVSDLVFFADPGTVNNHKDVHNLLFSDGSVKTSSDIQGQIIEACRGARTDEIDKVLDKVVFGDLFDPVYHQD